VAYIGDRKKQRREEFRNYKKKRQFSLFICFLLLTSLFLFSFFLFVSFFGERSLVSERLWSSLKFCPGKIGLLTLKPI
jgi:hypothetical protein